MCSYYALSLVNVNVEQEQGTPRRRSSKFRRPASDAVERELASDSEHRHQTKSSRVQQSQGEVHTRV